MNPLPLAIRILVAPRKTSPPYAAGATRSAGAGARGSTDSRCSLLPGRVACSGGRGQPSHHTPRMSGMLGFKAEVVLAFQLIARHRAPRLAMLLAATVVLMLLAEDGAAGSLAVRRRTVALIGGALSAVFASRLM